MSNEEMLDSDLELEEKLVIAGVLLLAGLFFWSLLGNKEKEVQIFEPVEKDEMIDNQSFFYEKEVNVERERPVAITQKKAVVQKASPIIETLPKVELNSKVPAIATPEIETVEMSRSIDEIQPIEIIKEVAPVVVPQPIQKVIPQPVKKITPPTIKPLFGDLSQGILKLSGTGKPKEILQLVVNGDTTAYIGIDNEGLWNYETLLKPGDYSIQVLMSDSGEKIKSAVSHITIPEPLVVEIEEKINNTIEEIKPNEISKKPEIIEKASVIQKKAREEDRYIVKYGDTLNKLSKRYNLTVSQLARLNNISDKDIILVGQILIIPGQ